MPTLNDLASEIIRSTVVMNAATTALAGTALTKDASIDSQQFADLMTALRAASDTLAAATALHPPLAPEDGTLNTDPLGDN